jgi:C1A family cysteine protease
MFDIDSYGLLRPDGSNAGGHEWLLHGYDPNYKGLGPAYKMLNSWGDSWGLNGHAYILVKDYEGLLADAGDACVALELAV